MPYDSGSTQESHPFIFATPDALELRELRERYGLEPLAADSKNDLEIRRICAWVHSRWPHDGWNEPSSPNALTILDLDTRSFGLFSGAKPTLSPVGAGEPTVFQRRFPVVDATYTHSARAFYPKPTCK